MVVCARGGSAISRCLDHCGLHQRENFLLRLKDVRRGQFEFRVWRPILLGEFARLKPVGVVKG